MSELTREQIETVRVLAQHYDGAPVELFGVSVRALCDMALRTHDAEADRDNCRAKFLGAEAESDKLLSQVEWLERNSVLKNPRQHPISEYLETKDEPEPVCPGSERGVHSDAWYDGDQCSICGHD